MSIWDSLLQRLNGTYNPTVSSTPIGLDPNASLQDSSLATTNPIKNDTPLPSTGQLRMGVANAISPRPMAPIQNTVNPQNTTPQASPQPPQTGKDWGSLVSSAYNIAKQYNIPPSVMIGQMAVETGHGTSPMSKNKNNMFGYKAYDSNPGAATSYATPQQSMIDYARLITSDPRYQNAMQYSNDPFRMITEIKKAGYATDPNYVKKVVNTPEFKQFMNESSAPAAMANKASQY